MSEELIDFVIELKDDMTEARDSAQCLAQGFVHPKQREIRARYEGVADILSEMLGKFYRLDIDELFEDDTEASDE